MHLASFVGLIYKPFLVLARYQNNVLQSACMLQIVAGYDSYLQILAKNREQESFSLQEKQKT